jgi:NAD(P)-dependent dehydrogenase (short-subunit alcohol dehydrogenase family)
MATNAFSLAGKHALITGGGTGIGLAISRAFCEAGARVIITGRREDVLQKACQTLGENATYRACDISQPEAIAPMIAEIEQQRIELDILVNNAGINAKKPTLEVTDEEFNRIIQTNLSGLFSLTRETCRVMAPRGRGAILNITSMAALYGLPKVTAYAASKTAVLGMTRTLAVEFAPNGIRINSLAPGFIYSEMTEKALNSDPDRKRRVMERTPMGRMGQPEEIGTAAVFLCSDAASFITGVNLAVDGGNSIGF